MKSPPQTNAEDYFTHVKSTDCLPRQDIKRKWRSCFLKLPYKDSMTIYDCQLIFRLIDGLDGVDFNTGAHGAGDRYASYVLTFSGNGFCF